MDVAGETDPNLWCTPSLHVPGSVAYTQWGMAGDRTHSAGLVLVAKARSRSCGEGGRLVEAYRTRRFTHILPAPLV